MPLFTTVRRTSITQISLFLLIFISSVTAKTNIATSLEELYDHLSLEIPNDGIDRTILILPFNTTEDTLKDEALMVSEYGVNYFVGTPGVIIVDRQNIANMMEELNFSNTQMIDQTTALTMGKMVSASYIITGSISQNQHIQTISAKMIETETSRVAGASYAKFRSDEAGDFYATALGEQLKPSSAMFRSMILPGWGQFYTDHPGHGITFATLFAGTAGVTIWSALDYRDKSETVDTYEEQKVKPNIGETEEDFLARKSKILNDATDEMNSASDRTNMLLIGLGGVWVSNVIDALILGKIESNKIEDTYFTLDLPENQSPVYHMGFTMNF